jgi:hypothetical protein
MAFTAGSVELAKANKLGNALAHLFTAHGLTGAAGRTGALMIEKMAKKLGFGITGITTGAGFPPFGSILPSSNSGTEAALQNPKGITRPSGFAIGAGIPEGQTVGIYLKKFVRTGADYRAVLYTGLTIGQTLGVGDTVASIWAVAGGVTLDYLDRLNFGNIPYGSTDVAGVTLNTGLNGVTAFAGVLQSIGLAAPYSGATKAIGSVFNIETIGVNSFTGVYSNQSAIAGTTFENFQGKGIVNGGFTATVYYNSPSGGSGTWVVS